MTLDELTILLETTQLPVAFDHFKTEQKLPYLVYIVTGNNNFSADNKMYHTDAVIQLELYTLFKSVDTESTVETVLNGVPFFYTKTEGYLSDEQMYMVTYQFTL